MQMVLHAPFGGRINRAWGLALRKKLLPSASASSCRRRPTRRRSSSRSGRSTASRSRTSSTTCIPDRARSARCRPCSTTPMFESRWRWNAQRVAAARAVAQNGKSGAARSSCACGPATCWRRAFPQALACPETLPPADRSRSRWTTRIVRQTIEDCLTEAMDVDGLPRGARRPARRHDRAASRSTRPSRRRSRAASCPRSRTRSSTTRRSRSGARRRCCSRRVLDAQDARRASARSIPRPSSACARRRGRSRRTPRRCTRRCSGWASSPTRRRAPWRAVARRAGGRPGASSARTTAGSPSEAPREPKKILRGRLEALGPVLVDARLATTRALLLELETDGAVLRTRHRRPDGLVRAPAARAHPPLHARPPAPRDRAGHGRAVPPVPRLLAARRRGVPARRPARRRRGARRSSPASRSRRRPGRPASCRRACAATGASGSTS